MKSASRWMAGILCFLAVEALAQAFPAKPVRIILRVAPGGLQDSLARAAAADLSKALGQPVLVEHRPSAGGIAAAELVARSAPDGYTLMQSDNIGFLVNEFLRTEKLPYVLEKDFAAVIGLVSAKNMAIASPKFPGSGMRDLVAIAKQKPGALNYASSGIGSIFHIDAEALAAEAGISMNHVPYKGGAPILQAMMAGEIDFSLIGMTAAIPLIRAGKIKALAYGGLQRSALFPDVPTLSESGFKSFDSGAWFWWLAPSATPRAVIDRLAAETGKVISAPEFRERHVAGVGHELLNVHGTKAMEMYAADKRTFAARVKPLNLKID
jgi:tripartite-type tricarboxylate transporter receptor subunit TctC